MWKMKWISNLIHFFSRWGIFYTAIGDWSIMLGKIIDHSELTNSIIRWSRKNYILNGIKKKVHNIEHFTFQDFQLTVFLLRSDHFPAWKFCLLGALESSQNSESKSSRRHVRLSKHRGIDFTSHKTMKTHCRINAFLFIIDLSCGLFDCLGSSVLLYTSVTWSLLLHYDDWEKRIMHRWW